MVATNTTTAPAPVNSGSAAGEAGSVSNDEMAAKAVHKRFEGLVMVRTKAIKGKGAWYWAHLEPLLVQNPETSLPKAVKLRCSLCDAVFSASNPSRTASEHLKRGTCPNFNSVAKPISSVSPTSASLASPPPPPRRPPQLLHLWLLSWPNSSPSAALMYGWVFCSYYKFLHFFLVNDV
jgi:hypothetical protein